MSLQGKIGSQGGGKGELLPPWPAQFLQGFRAPLQRGSLCTRLQLELEAEREAFRAARRTAACSTFCLANGDALSNFTMRRETVYSIKSKAWSWLSDAHAVLYTGRHLIEAQIKMSYVSKFPLQTIKPMELKTILK